VCARRVLEFKEGKMTLPAGAPMALSGPLTQAVERWRLHSTSVGTAPAAAVAAVQAGGGAAQLPAGFVVPPASPP